MIVELAIWFGVAAAIFSASFSIAYTMAKGHAPNFSLRRAVLRAFKPASWEGPEIANWPNWQLDARKGDTLCQCCAYRTRPYCKGNGGELEHSWVVVHSWRSIFVRCWHCDYRMKVGSRREIQNVQDGLVAHLTLLEQMQERAAAREFDEYRAKLLKRYGRENRMN